MKTSLLLIATGSLLLASCKSGPDSTGHTNPAQAGTGTPKAAGAAGQAGLARIHRIDVTFDDKYLHSHGHESELNNDSHQVTWKLRGDAGPALSEKVHPNEVVQWHLNSKFFLYVHAKRLNWDACKDVDGNPLLWTNCTSCPFNDTDHRALCATQSGDWVVSIVFPTNAAKDGDHIGYRLVHGLDCLQAQERILSPTYDYSTLEATLVWDSSSFEDKKTAPSK